MKLVIKKFDNLTVEELYELLKLRQDVFIIEQECIYSDIDSRDYNSMHLLLKEKTTLVGYLRILPPGLSYKEASIGRVCIAESARKRGYAKKIMQRAIEYVSEHYKNTDLKISAQEYLQEFYRTLGFQVTSEMYLEDGIPHIDMEFMKQ